MELMSKKKFSSVVAWIRENEFLLVVVLLSVLLRIPSLFEPGWYGDEGIYLVMGEGLKKGLVWYRELHDNKPPLLYLLAAMAGSVTYFRAVLLGWMVATTVVFDRLSKKLMGEGWWQKLSLVIMVALSTLPCLEGNIANAEIFMMLPTMLGVLLLIRARKDKEGSKFDYLASGICFSLAFLFKVPVLFETVGVVFFWVVMEKGWKGVVKELKRVGWYWMVAGFVLPVVLTVVYYYLVGAGAEYLRAAFLQNIGYLSSWQRGSMTKSGGSSESGLMMRGVVLLVLTAVFGWGTKRMEWEYRMVGIWFLFALFGALLSERPYPHYLILAISSVALLMGLLAKEWKKGERWLWTVMLTVVTMVGVVKYGFYFYPTMSYYGDFLQMVKGEKSYEEYANDFDWRVERTRELSSYLREITDPGEKIFVWGDEPFVYFESETLPVGRYIVAYHIVDFEAREETMEKLREEKPRVVINMVSEKRKFEDFHAWRENNYGLAERISDAEVYIRVEAEK